MSNVSSQCLWCSAIIRDGKSRCLSCGKWNIAGISTSNHNDSDSVLLSQIDRSRVHDRLNVGEYGKAWGKSFDRTTGKLLSEGLVKSSVTYLGGEPGAGKTTLMLHMMSNIKIEKSSYPLFIAAEQSAEELAMTADRLDVKTEVRIVPAMNGANVAKVLQQFNPPMVVIDSLQGLVGKDDSAQFGVLKASKHHAVRLHCPVIVISHVTKDVMLQGNMSNQHEVDVTMMFYTEGNKRVLTPLKNRMGPAFTETIFGMDEAGLVFLDHIMPGKESDNEDG